MKVHYDSNAHYLVELNRSLAKDPESFADWRCLHLKPVGTAHCLHALISYVRDNRDTDDCDLVMSSACDIFIFGRQRHLPAYKALCTEFCVDETAFVVYDLYKDCTKVTDLLADKAEERSQPSPADDGYKFDDLDVLNGVFQVEKKKRRTRSPAYILLVEDDAFTCGAVMALLKGDYAIVTAQNARDAISNYQLYAPDLVFLDIGLPDHSGFDVLRRMLALDADAYIVMFSGDSGLGNVIGTLNAGAAGFISKPFTREKLGFYISQIGPHHNKTSI